VSGKVNPRRRPATMADVNRAVEQATNDALAASAAIFLTVLCDKESADAEIIQRVWEEMQELSQSIIDGYVSVADLKDTLRKEYGVDIHF
jgi:hypothetical protein